MKKMTDIMGLLLIIFIWAMLSISDLIGLGIPLIKSFFGFILVTIVPGIIILRIIKVKPLNNFKLMLYSVGLSLAFVSMLGIFINYIYPSIGIKNPLSTPTINLTFIFSITLLWIISYIQNRNSFYEINIDIKPYLSNSGIFLLILPLISVIGTYLINYYDKNTILLIFLILISLVPILIVFNKIPKKLYPLCILATSISLLFYTSLISQYIWGWDVNTEYYFAKIAIQNGYWNYSLPYQYNSIPMLTILSSFYYSFLNLNLIWIFKIIFPILFSLVPLGIYYICKDQFEGDLIPALAPFVFMFYYGFFKTMPGKQMIAEIFLVLLILLIIDKKLPSMAKKIMAILFSFALIISHYGVSYLFMLMLIFIIISALLFKNEFNKNSIIKIGFGTLFTVLAVSWFMYISGGVSLDNIIGIGNNVVTNINEIVQSQPSRSGSSYSLLEMPTITWSVYQGLNYLLQFFIAFGIIKLLYNFFRKKKLICNFEYAAISIAAYSFLMISIFLTFSLGMDRALQINLIVLSPFAIIGCQYIFEVIISILKKVRLPLNSNSKDLKVPLKIFGVFLTIFLLFSSSLVFEVTKDPYPSLFTLNKKTEFPVFTSEEIGGANWLKSYTDGNQIFTESRGSALPNHRTTLLLSSFFIYDSLTKFYFHQDRINIPSNSYIYFGSFAEKGILLGNKTFGWNKEHIPLKNTLFYNKVILNSSQIYENGGSSVYYLI